MPIGTSLTGVQLYALFNSLLGNSGQSTIDKVTFYSLINVVKNNIEMMQEWNFLKAIDKSQQWSPSDTFLTQKNMPTDWNFWQSESPIAIVDPNNSETYEYLPEITMQKQLEYQEQTYRFLADYNAGKIQIMGDADRVYDIWQFYLKSSPDFSIEAPDYGDAQSWVFPGTAHPLLAFYAAAMYKEGIDFDTVNARAAGGNMKVAQSIMTWLAKWNGRLASGSLRGINRGLRDHTQFISGHVNLTNDENDWD